MKNVKVISKSIRYNKKTLLGHTLKETEQRNTLKTK